MTKALWILASRLTTKGSIALSPCSVWPHGIWSGISLVCGNTYCCVVRSLSFWQWFAWVIFNFMRKYPGIFVDMDLARSWKLAMSDTRGSPWLVTFQQCLHFCSVRTAFLSTTIRVTNFPHVLGIRRTFLTLVFRSAVFEMYKLRAAHGRARRFEFRPTIFCMLVN